MSTDRVFKEEDAIWWDANVRSPRRYSLQEMDEEYEGISPFSTDVGHRGRRNVEHVYVIDPEAVYAVGVNVNWLNIIALVIVMLAVVAVAALFAMVAAVAVVFAGVVLGIMALVFS